MTKQDFITWAQGRGWVLDQYGHLRKTFESGVITDPETQTTTTRFEARYCRYKMSRIAVRYEVKSGNGWIRIRSGYFSKLSISESGKLIGMVR